MQMVRCMLKQQATVNGGNGAKDILGQTVKTDGTTVGYAKLQMLKWCRWFFSGDNRLYLQTQMNQIRQSVYTNYLGKVYISTISGL